MTIKDAALNLAGFLEVLAVVRFIKTENKIGCWGLGDQYLTKSGFQLKKMENSRSE